VDKAYGQQIDRQAAAQDRQAAEVSMRRRFGGLYMQTYAAPVS
jgi:hypothetical protein